jgi:hypothetical protein
MNSRAKGKVGELEAAALLRDNGFDARRGQQFQGGAGSPDVVCDALPGIHLEVKRVEAGNPYVWMAQAKRDAPGKTPVVLHRKNRQDWLAILPAADFLALLKKAQQPHE